MQGKEKLACTTWYCHNVLSGCNSCVLHHVMLIYCICYPRWWPVSEHRSPEDVLNWKWTPVM
uniref:Uncharacterized protein n=1 Tax=Zea mays TaxID=4577 RepID=C0PP17_MAIZE|nr:unknown [Zea mays]